MEKNNANFSNEVMRLLRLKRYLWHQLRLLVDRQRELAGDDSPEEVLGIVSGRSKLFSELRRVESQLDPLMSNWDELAGSLSIEKKIESEQLGRQIEEVKSYVNSGLTPELVFGVCGVGRDIPRGRITSDENLERVCRREI